MNQNSNYYKLLGIDPSVPQTELESVFKALFSRYNPSSNPNSMYLRTMFQQLNEAYEVLGDSAKREQYNIERGFEVPSSSRQVSTREESISPPEPQVGYQMPPLPSTENARDRREPAVQVNDYNNGTSNNKAYVFLFVLIGVLIVGGGVFAYFEFSDSNKAIEVEETVEVEATNEKEQSNVVVDKEIEEEVKGEIRVRESHDNIPEVEETTESKANIKNDKELTPISEKKQSETTNVVNQRNKAEEKKVIESTAGNNNEVKKEAVAKRLFKLGTTKNEVWAAKGDPTDIKTQGDVEVWYYGKSKVKFRDGKVVD